MKIDFNSNVKQLQFAVLAFFVLPMAACGQKSETFEVALKGIYKNTVPLVHENEIDTWNSAILLDTRNPEEFEVSHLPNARLVGYEEFSLDSVSSISKLDTIVVYCSVGYRSERVGEKLLAAGYKNVFNLYGGIFDWKNQNRIVVTSKNDTTEKVHAYNRVWGVFLKNGEKVY